VNIIIDGRALRVYPVGGEGFRGGTETYLARIAHGLARKHIVHVLTPDLEEPEQRGPTLWWWPPTSHPVSCDVYVPWHNLEFLGTVATDRVVFASNGLGADRGAQPDLVADVVTFSDCHTELLEKEMPLWKGRCRVLGLGVDLDEYPKAMPTKDRRVMLVGNDPARWAPMLLDVFDRVRREVPDAQLHVTYTDLVEEYERYRWGQNAFDEVMRESVVRLSRTPGISILGRLDRAGLVREQVVAGVHCYPSDPPNLGSQIHGIFQMECAAAWTPLILSDVEAFPEVFKDTGYMLPRVGTFDGESRVGADWYASAVVHVMGLGDTEYGRMARKARLVAEKHRWKDVIQRWERLLAS